MRRNKNLSSRWRLCNATLDSRDQQGPPRFTVCESSPIDSLEMANSIRHQPRSRPGRRSPNGPLGLPPSCRASLPPCIVESLVPALTPGQLRSRPAAGGTRDEHASDAVNVCEGSPIDVSQPAAAVGMSHVLDPADVAEQSIGAASVPPSIPASVHRRTAVPGLDAQSGTQPPGGGANEGWPCFRCRSLSAKVPKSTSRNRPQGSASATFSTPPAVAEWPNWGYLCPGEHPCPVHRRTAGPGPDARSVMQLAG